MNDKRPDINKILFEIYSKYPEKVQNTVRKVIEAERAKLHMGNPLGIHEDILGIIKDEEK